MKCNDIFIMKCSITRLYNDRGNRYVDSRCAISEDIFFYELSIYDESLSFSLCMVRSLSAHKR